jgi:hypothetical protein
MPAGAAFDQLGTTRGCIIFISAGMSFLPYPYQVPSCAGVKRESLKFLTDNALHTKRFAYQVGRRCRNSAIKEVADELHLDWHSVKELDKQYMCGSTLWRASA